MISAFANKICKFAQISGTISSFCMFFGKRRRLCRHELKYTGVLRNANTDRALLLCDVTAELKVWQILIKGVLRESSNIFLVNMNRNTHHKCEPRQSPPQSSSSVSVHLDT